MRVITYKDDYLKSRVESIDTTLGGIVKYLMKTDFPAQMMSEMQKLAYETVIRDVKSDMMRGYVYGNLDSRTVFDSILALQDLTETDVVTRLPDMSYPLKTVIGFLKEIAENASPEDLGKAS